MAYSLNDLYRPLRVIMRGNGFITGIGLGGALLGSPIAWLSEWHLYQTGPLWSVRLAGALLVAFGILLLLASTERVISVASMVTMIVANILIAIVILMAYLQGEFAGLSLTGQIVLVIIFLICLVGAVFPLRYLRADSQIL